MGVGLFWVIPGLFKFRDEIWGCPGVFISQAPNRLDKHGSSGHTPNWIGRVPGLPWSFQECISNPDWDLPAEGFCTGDKRLQSSGVHTGERCGGSDWAGHGRGRRRCATHTTRAAHAADGWGP
jgi:hypothetical protein